MKVAALTRSFLIAERETIFAFIFSRSLLWVLAWFAFAWFPHEELDSFAGQTELWNLLHRWDANWYRGIVESGYTYSRVGESRAAFFPLYPLCVVAVRALTGGEVPLVGFLVSNLFLFAAVIVFRRLVAMDFPAPSRVPERSVWLLLLQPMTFFHSAVYSESLFLVLSLAAILAARQKRWALAGVAGAFLTATRATGLLILVPLFWEALLGFNRATPAKAKFIRARAWLLLVPLGLLAFCAYLHFRFGDALGFAHTMSAGWGRGFVPPWEGISSALSRYQPAYAALFIGAEIFALALLVLAAILRLRMSYLLYAGAMLLLLASTTLLESLPRYVSVIFPLPLALAVATARFEGAYVAVLVLSTGLMALCLALFVDGYWMT